MKALSILQPWAWLIVNGLKSVENRTWRTSFRGTFLVHTGKGFDDEGLAHVKLAEPDIFATMPETFDRGGIVGQADLVDVVDHYPSPWFFGPVGFVLDNAKPLPFRPLLGERGFFDVAGGAETPIGDKVAHVLAAPNPGGHTCHWPGCTTLVKPAQWGCTQHWRRLPKPIQRQIWGAYRPGQETDKRPSAAYIAAAHAAQEWIAKFEARRTAQGSLL